MFIFIVFLLTIIISLFLQSLIFPMPISDTGTVRHRTIPWMTFALIFANSVIFIAWQAPNLYQGSQLYSIGDPAGKRMLYAYVTQVWTYGYRAVFLTGEGASIGAFVSFTSMFMHGDMWHLLGNMIYLWSFGRRVEDACGAWRFLIFYLMAGMMANIGSELLNPANTDIPAIGSSGAIAGVMGAYLILFPGALVLCFWGIGSALRVPVVLALKIAGVKRVRGAPLLRLTIRLPAWALLIPWLVMNTLPSLEVIQRGQYYGGVDTLAHLTGFLAALLIFLYVRKGVLSRYFAGRSL